MEIRFAQFKANARPARGDYVKAVSSGLREMQLAINCLFRMCVEWRLSETHVSIWLQTEIALIVPFVAN